MGIFLEPLELTKLTYLIYIQGMKYTLSTAQNPQFDELKNVFGKAFDELKDEDQDTFPKNLSQGFSEWFSLEDMVTYLPHGVLVEARSEDTHALLGAAFVGKQNPISWPDGYKANLFILAVIPSARNQGIGKALLQRCEQEAKRFGAQKLLIDTHVAMEKTSAFYEHQGYHVIGTLKEYYGNGEATFFCKELT